MLRVAVEALRANAGVLLLGVITAALGTCSGLSLQILAQHCSASVPALQTSSCYIFLLLFWLPLAVHQHGWKQIYRSTSWFVYPMVGLLDVAANYLVVWAFEYATIRAVALTSSASVPFVMMISAFLGKPPRVAEVIGAILCLTGVAVYAGNQSTTTSSGPFVHQVVGCLLALGSALCYALVNIACERLMQSKLHQVPISIYLAGLSICALFFSLLVGLVRSSHEVANFTRATELCGPAAVWMILLCFASIIFVYYSVAIFVLHHGSATWFNVALLSINLFAFAGARLVFGTPLDLFYFFCLSLVMSGLIVFYVPSPPCTISALRSLGKKQLRTSLAA